MGESQADQSTICEYRLVGGLQRSPLRRFPLEIPVDRLLSLKDLDRSTRRRSRLGWWWSSTTADHVGFASTAQERCLLALDADPSISWIVHEPLALVSEEGEKRIDYVVIRAGTPAVVAPLCRGGVPDADTLAVDAFCRATGWSSMPEPAVSEPGSQNLRWLAGFRHPNKCDDQAIPPILAHFARGSTLGSFLHATSDALPTVYHLLWRGLLHVDMEHPLDRNSLIWSSR